MNIAIKREHHLFVQNEPIAAIIVYVCQSVSDFVCVCIWFISNECATSELEVIFFLVNQNVVFCQKSLLLHYIIISIYIYINLKDSFWFSYDNFLFPFYKSSQFTFELHLFYKSIYFNLIF